MASTATISIEAVPDRVRTAIEATARLYGVDRPLSSVAAACCTTGDPVHRRFGRAKEPPQDYLILTPSYLIAVRDAERPGAVIWSLADAEVHLVTESVGGTAVTGLAISAFRPGAAQRESALLPLADDDQGRAFAERVTER